MEKVVFLDRDGVINEKAPEHEYVTEWGKFRFLPDAAEGIKKLNGAGYRIVIVSNQRGVARGLMTAEQVDEIHRRMCAELEKCGAHIDDIYVCPHGEGECSCRKPEIGLFLMAERKFAVDKSASWMIGDSESDVEAGRRYGVRTVLVRNDGDFGGARADGLLAAAEYIIREDGK